MQCGAGVSSNTWSTHWSGVRGPSHTSSAHSLTSWSSSVHPLNRDSSPTTCSSGWKPTSSRLAPPAVGGREWYGLPSPQIMFESHTGPRVLCHKAEALVDRYLDTTTLPWVKVSTSLCACVCVRVGVVTGDGAQ